MTCQPCLRGYYRSDDYFDKCFACPLETTTLVEGAFSSSQCLGNVFIFYMPLHSMPLKHLPLHRGDGIITINKYLHSKCLNQFYIRLIKKQ